MDKIKQALDVLSDARDEVMPLVASVHPTIAIGFQRKFDLMINQLSQISGEASVSLSTAPSFGPVTEFMGESLTPSKSITTDDLTPQQLEVKNFRLKVDKLEEQFDDLTNEQILEGYRQDQNVVRGVAKRAGLEEFKTLEFNEAFLNLIREARADQTEANLANAKAEKDLI